MRCWTGRHHSRRYTENPSRSILVKQQAAVDVVGLAGDEAGLLGGQEADHIGDIRRFGDAPYSTGALSHAATACDPFDG